MMNRLVWLSVVVLLACASFTPPVAVNGVVSLADYTSLQAAVNAVPNGGTVVIPAGVWDVGTVDINAVQLWQKVVTIQGVSPGYFPSSAPRGSGEYNYLVNGGYVYGTVIRGTLDVTTAGAKLYLRDLAMIGDGEGVAVDVGDGSGMYPDALYMDGVYIGNYETAVRVQKGYYLTLANMTIAGVDTGLQITDSNRISLTDIDIMTCDIGATLQGDTISFVGGSVQGCGNGVIFGVDVGALSQTHFEDISGLSLSLTGNGNQIGANYYASNAGSVEISGDNNNVVLGLNPSGTVVLTESASYNHIRGSAYLQCDDNGFANKCERPYPTD